jgi:hypothetical protein
MSTQQRLPGGIGHFGHVGGRNSKRNPAKHPADLLRHALRRERRAKNRNLAGFSLVPSFYQGQITDSTTK